MTTKEVFDNKIRKAFRFFDLNSNGILTREEMVRSADIISSLSNASEVDRDNTRSQWAKWCEAVFPEGQVTEDLYVERIVENTGILPELLRAETQVTYLVMFDRLDANKDGFISPEELRLYYKAFGYDEDYDIDQIFRTLDDNKDGLISRDEFVRAGVTYWSEEPGYEFFYEPSLQVTRL